MTDTRKLASGKRIVNIGAMIDGDKRRSDSRAPSSPLPFHLNFRPTPFSMHQFSPRGCNGGPHLYEYFRPVEVLEWS
jgi:hypothetical protein